MKSSACLGRASGARRVSTGFGAALAGLLLGVLPAQAGTCGDDVAGERVACACGDIVVSDTVLSPLDPVTVERCPGNGLVVLASPDADGITLDLGGQSIVGSGRGVGIRVVRGGRVGSTIVGGAAEESRAEIAAFDTGIRAHGAADLVEISGIDVHHNERYGLKIRTSGVEVRDVRSTANGKDGVALSGHGIAVSGVAADGNLRDGIQVRGAGAVIDGEASGNGRNGAVLGGRGAVVNSLRSSDNASAGVVATGSGHVLSGVDARGNAGGDIAGRPEAVR